MSVKKSGRIRTPSRRVSESNESRPGTSLPPKPGPSDPRTAAVTNDNSQPGCSGNVPIGGNGDARSQEHRIGSGSRQEEASGAMYDIIETTIPGNLRTHHHEVTAEPDVSKDEIIHNLKTEVCELKNDRKRLLEHIDALSALRKEHETKIKELEVTSITLKARQSPKKKLTLCEKIQTVLLL